MPDTAHLVHHMPDTAQFVRHMNAMQVHYDSGATHSYALPLDLINSTVRGAPELFGFAALPDATTKLNDLLGKAEKTYTSLASNEESAATTAVKDFLITH